MSGNEINELRRLAAGYAIERVQPFEDVTGLASALVRRYLMTFEESLDDYEASWTPLARTRTAAPGPRGTRSTSTSAPRYVGLEWPSAPSRCSTGARSPRRTSTT